MKRTFPYKTETLCALTANMLDGLNRHASDLDVVLITEAILRNALVTAEAAERGFGEARAAKRLAYQAQAQADLQGRKFIRVTRNLLAVHLGEQYSEAWEPVGFPNLTTAIPVTIADRQTLLRSLEGYLGNHSVYENASIEVTSAQAGVRFHALSSACSGVNNAVEEAEIAKRIRDAAIAELRRKMRGCVDELSQLMADDDPRWYAFGLTPPAFGDAPEAVDLVELVAAGPGAVLASWDGAPRADRYRVFKQIVGVDAEPVPVETVHDTQFAFTGLTAGRTLKVFVIAGNDEGVSQASPTAEIVVQ